MSYQLIVKPLAEQDIKEIYSWYEGERLGLGDEFLEELERSIDFIKSNPYQYQVRFKDVRKTKIHRFPICLHHTVEEEKVFIQAVLSTHQNPRLWERRS